jgi:superfamily I DNA and/or RNA helicase
MNFGPLNRDGGWRRLNVLITRAKWHTILVTSLRSKELDGVNPNNRGALALQNFIEYAERGGGRFQFSSPRSPMRRPTISRTPSPKRCASAACR